MGIFSRLVMQKLGGYTESIEKGKINNNKTEGKDNG